MLIQEAKVPIEEALKLITTNPAANLGLRNKGTIQLGYDADFCCLDADFNLTDVFAKGKQMMADTVVTARGHFE